MGAKVKFAIHSGYENTDQLLLEKKGSVATITPFLIHAQNKKRKIKQMQSMLALF